MADAAAENPPDDGGGAADDQESTVDQSRVTDFKVQFADVPLMDQFFRRSDLKHSDIMKLCDIILKIYGIDYALCFTPNMFKDAVNGVRLYISADIPIPPELVHSLYTGKLCISQSEMDRMMKTFEERKGDDSIVALPKEERLSLMSNVFLGDQKLRERNLKVSFSKQIDSYEYQEDTYPVRCEGNYSFGVASLLGKSVVQKKESSNDLILQTYTQIPYNHRDASSERIDGNPSEEGDKRFGVIHSALRTKGADHLDFSKDDATLSIYSTHHASIYSVFPKWDENHVLDQEEWQAKHTERALKPDKPVLRLCETVQKDVEGNKKVVSGAYGVPAKETEVKLLWKLIFGFDISERYNLEEKLWFMQPNGVKVMTLMRATLESIHREFNGLSRVEDIWRLCFRVRKNSGIKIFAGLNTGITNHEYSTAQARRETEMIIEYVANVSLAAVDGANRMTVADYMYHYTLSEYTIRAKEERHRPESYVQSKPLFHKIGKSNKMFLVVRHAQFSESINGFVQGQKVSMQRLSELMQELNTKSVATNFVDRLYRWAVRIKEIHGDPEYASLWRQPELLVWQSRHTTIIEEPQIYDFGAFKMFENETLFPASAEELRWQATPTIDPVRGDKKVIKAWVVRLTMRVFEEMHNMGVPGLKKLMRTAMPTQASDEKLHEFEPNKLITLLHRNETAVGQLYKANTCRSGSHVQINSLRSIFLNAMPFYPEASEQPIDGFINLIQTNGVPALPLIEDNSNFGPNIHDWKKCMTYPDGKYDGFLKGKEGPAERSTVFKMQGHKFLECDDNVAIDTFLLEYAILRPANHVIDAYTGMQKKSCKTVPVEPLAERISPYVHGEFERIVSLVGAHIALDEKIREWAPDIYRLLRWNPFKEGEADKYDPDFKKADPDSGKKKPTDSRWTSDLKRFINRPSDVWTNIPMFACLVVFFLCDEQTAFFNIEPPERFTELKDVKAAKELLKDNDPEELPKTFRKNMFLMRKEFVLGKEAICDNKTAFRQRKKLSLYSNPSVTIKPSNMPRRIRSLALFFFPSLKGKVKNRVKSDEATWKRLNDLVVEKWDMKTHFIEPMSTGNKKVRVKMSAFMDAKFEREKKEREQRLSVNSRAPQGVLQDKLIETLKKLEKSEETNDALEPVKDALDKAVKDLKRKTPKKKKKKNNKRKRDKEGDDDDDDGDDLGGWGMGSGGRSGDGSDDPDSDDSETDDSVEHIVRKSGSAGRSGGSAAGNAAALNTRIERLQIQLAGEKAARKKADAKAIKEENLKAALGKKLIAATQNGERGSGEQDDRDAVISRMKSKLDKANSTIEEQKREIRKTMNDLKGYQNTCSDIDHHLDLYIDLLKDDMDVVKKVRDEASLNKSMAVHRISELARDVRHHLTKNLIAKAVAINESWAREHNKGSNYLKQWMFTFGESDETKFVTGQTETDGTIVEYPICNEVLRCNYDPFRGHPMTMALRFLLTRFTILRTRQLKDEKWKNDAIRIIVKKDDSQLVLQTSQREGSGEEVINELSKNVSFKYDMMKKFVYEDTTTAFDDNRTDSKKPPPGGPSDRKDSEESDFTKKPNARSDHKEPSEKQKNTMKKTSGQEEVHCSSSEDESDHKEPSQKQKNTKKKTPVQEEVHCSSSEDDNGVALADVDDDDSKDNSWSKMMNALKAGEDPGISEHSSEQEETGTKKKLTKKSSEEVVELLGDSSNSSDSSEAEKSPEKSENKVDPKENTSGNGSEDSPERVIAIKKKAIVESGAELGSGGEPDSSESETEMQIENLNNPTGSKEQEDDDDSDDTEVKKKVKQPNTRSSQKRQRDFNESEPESASYVPDEAATNNIAAKNKKSKANQKKMPARGGKSKKPPTAPKPAKRNLGKELEEEANARKKRKTTDSSSGTVSGLRRSRRMTPNKQSQDQIKSQIMYLGTKEDSYLNRMTNLIQTDDDYKAAWNEAKQIAIELFESSDYNNNGKKQYMQNLIKNRYVYATAFNELKEHVIEQGRVVQGKEESHPLRKNFVEQSKTKYHYHVVLHQR